MNGEEEEEFDYISITYTSKKNKPTTTTRTDISCSIYVHDSMDRKVNGRKDRSRSNAEGVNSRVTRVQKDGKVMVPVEENKLPLLQHQENGVK